MLGMGYKPEWVNISGPDVRDLQNIQSETFLSKCYSECIADVSIFTCFVTDDWNEQLNVLSDGLLFFRS